MNDERYYALRARVAEAEHKKEVYEAHIRPYVEGKEQQLFQAFCCVSANDLNQLQLIKMQHSVLVGLKNSFIYGIEDGIIASEELRQSGVQDVQIQ